MSSSPMPWIKLATSLLENAAFRLMPEPAQLRYYQLLQLAGRCDAGGGFFQNGQQMDIPLIAWDLRIEEDVLARDLEILQKSGFIYLNGRGWEITEFMESQGPASHMEQRAAWVKRQQKHREKIRATVTGDKEVTEPDVTGDKEVTHAPRVRVKSQSQESESDRESESVLELEGQQPTTDDYQNTLTKTTICEIAGIPIKVRGKTLRQLLITDTAISPADILAELSRNYARKGSQAGQVKDPAMITGINLAKHERPSIDWYEESQWTKYLPTGIAQKLGPLVSELGIASTQVGVSGYTHLRGEKVAAAVDAFLGRSSNETEEDTP